MGKPEKLNKMKSFFQSIKPMLVIIFSIVLGLFLILMAILLIYSPGKIEQYLDDNGKPISGSISEKIFIKIGGVNQGMFIKSKNINNPILLYVHGGPAFPNYFLFDKYKPELEDYFTVCYWEQRGGGLSYTSDVSVRTMTLQQLTLDAVEVTNYLRSRFKKEKIYIMAHSGGTPIALMAVYQKPELYLAYIAMAQMTNQIESEQIAYKYMLEQYATNGSQKRVNQLEKFKVLESIANTISFYKSAIRDQSMHELGIGTMHKMNSVFRDIFIPVWTCRAYTIKEKINIWKSKLSFLPKTNLTSEILETDFTLKTPKLNIPVYFLSGKFDYTVNIDLSKAYFLKLNAPLKGFYTFNNSAHSPLFEEPLLVRRIIENDILKQTNSLSDKD